MAKEIAIVLPSGKRDTITRYEAKINGEVKVTFTSALTGRTGTHRDRNAVVANNIALEKIKRQLGL